MNDVERVVRARLAARCAGASTAQLALLDHHMVPGRADVEGWIADARREGFTSLRTSALFPESRQAFLDAGFEPVDRLVLLRRPITGRDARRERRSSRRMRAADLGAAAAVDGAAFGGSWSNDAAALAEIGRATPSHRSRVIGRPLAAFAISGRAGTTGYIQRLAVDPARQGRGLGRSLLRDGLAWMARHGASSVLVNTGVGNDRAIGLYTSEGFVVMPEELIVLERSLD